MYWIPHFSQLIKYTAIFDLQLKHTSFGRESYFCDSTCEFSGCLHECKYDTGICSGFMSVCTKICLRFIQHFCTITKRVFQVMRIQKNFLIILLVFALTVGFPGLNIRINGIVLIDPNGYIVPAEFGVHFLPRMKDVPKQTKLHLNEIGLTNNELCKRKIQLRQPPVSWTKCYFSTFCYMGVRVNVTAKL